MAKIVTEIEVCDRCGKQFEVTPLFNCLPKLRVEERPSKRLVWRDRWDVYSFKREHELCVDCSKEFDKWMDGGADGEEKSKDR